MMVDQIDAKDHQLGLPIFSFSMWRMENPCLQMITGAGDGGSDSRLFKRNEKKHGKTNEVIEYHHSHL